MFAPYQAISDSFILFGFFSNPCCAIFLKYFFWFIDSTAEDGDRKQGEREGEWYAAKGPRPGV